MFFSKLWVEGAKPRGSGSLQTAVDNILLCVVNNLTTATGRLYKLDDQITKQITDTFTKFSDRHFRAEVKEYSIHMTEYLIT